MRFEAGYIQLGRCGGKNACIVCTSQHLARAREEIAFDLEALHQSQGVAYWQRLSCAHDENQWLTQKYDQISHAWGNMRRSRGFLWASQQANHPVCIRVLEETLTWFGWYPHYHVLWLFPPGTLESTATWFLDEVTRLWVIASNKNTQLITTSAAQYTDYEQLDIANGSLAGYLLKHGYYDLSFDEAVENPYDSSLSPFEVLRVYCATGDWRLKAFYWLFEKSSKGQRRVLFSPDYDQALEVWSS